MQGSSWFPNISRHSNTVARAGGTPVRRTGDPAPAQASGAGLLSVFIVLALIALVLLPAIVEREVQGVQEEIEQAADPARTMITEVQYLLARQTSVLRGYYITGDTASLVQFRTLHEQEEDLYTQLDPLVERLGDDVRERFIELRALSRGWHASLDLSELGPRGFREFGVTGQMPFEQSLYLAALESAARLDDAVAEASQQRRQEITAAERRGRLMHGVLALLALAAAVAVARLTYRVRRLAAESATRRRVAEQALEDRARLIEARARLLRGVTHDVKNPLGAADAYAALLEQGMKGPVPPEQMEFLARIRSLIGSALGMIGDLLDLTILEGAGLLIQPQLADVSATVQRAVEDQRAAAEQQGHQLRLTIGTELPPVRTDHVRVQQVLHNLLSNAIKYTPPPGTIEVVLDRAARQKEGDAASWIAISVRDTGPGIPDAARGTIFEEFTRLEDGAGQPGHGLGLAISYRITRLLHGDLTVSDAPGGGAQFTLWLPLITEDATVYRAEAAAL